MTLTETIQAKECSAESERKARARSVETKKERRECADKYSYASVGVKKGKRRSDAKGGLVRAEGAEGLTA